MLDGLTYANYPIVSGTECTAALRSILACHLFDVGYKWEREKHMSYSQEADYKVCPEWADDMAELEKKIADGGYDETYGHLADGKVDVVIAGRMPTQEEVEYAKKHGFEFVCRQIAWDALVFVVNNNNPLNSLMQDEIVDIYTHKTTNWKELDGSDAEIKTIGHYGNMACQVMFENKVLGNVNLPEDAYSLRYGVMHDVFGVTENNDGYILYTILLLQCDKKQRKG